MIKLKEIFQSIILNKNENDFLKDIDHLDGFKFIEHKNINNKDVWFFKRKIDDYVIKAYVFLNKEKWNFKTLVFWKKETSVPTNGSGKDNEHLYGPYDSYEDMVKDLDLKLKNNPVLNPVIYHDDDEFNKDKECLHLFKRLKTFSDKLNRTNDNYFNELKKYYNDTKNMSDEDILRYCQKIAPDDSDKQDLYLDLQKMDKLDFYDGINKMF